MRYFRVWWADADGIAQRSDPLSKWTDAELYRREMVASGFADAYILQY